MNSNQAVGVNQFDLAGSRKRANIAPRHRDPNKKQKSYMWQSGSMCDLAWKPKTTLGSHSHEAAKGKIPLA